MILYPDLTPTKGHKERTVMVPYDLAVAMNHYFTFERPKLAVLYRKKYGKEAFQLELRVSMGSGTEGNDLPPLGWSTYSMVRQPASSRVHIAVAQSASA